MSTYLKKLVLFCCFIVALLLATLFSWVAGSRFLISLTGLPWYLVYPAVIIPLIVLDGGAFKLFLWAMGRDLEQRSSFPRSLS